MPLHLLGKKSWNVYNADNIARVRRDEAAARDREEAAEQRMQEVDAARRLAILRGEIPPPLEEDAGADARDDDGRGSSRRGAPAGSLGTSKRKRKRVGEDDTDFEMRMAREQVDAGARTTTAMTTTTTRAAKSISLVDAAGHISLFGDSAVKPVEKNEEAEREAAKKRREVQDQYQMRFTNAAGKDGTGLTDGGPWYAKGGQGGTGIDDTEEPLRDVWGNEDAGRKDRSVARLDASDPLAMMKKAAAKVREIDKERKRENEERERELRQMRKEDRRREKRRRREGRSKGDGGEDESDGLEGFSLDAPRNSKDSSKTVEELDRSRNTGRRDEDRGRHRDSEDGRHRHKSHHHHHSHRHHSQHHSRHRDRDR